MRAIYRIRNVINGKIYIGSSVNLKKRWYEHRRQLCNGDHGNHYLQASWKKYGEEAFLFEIVEECDHLDDAAMLDREQWHLDNSGCLKNGYNIRPRADATTHSPESIEKCRLARIGKKRKPETIARMRASMLGKKHSDETKEKISRSGAGRICGPCSPEKKEKLRQANLGKKQSQETRDKCRAAQVRINLTSKFRKPIEQIDQNSGDVIATFPSINSAVRATNTDRTALSQCCSGRNKTANGFVWRYKIGNAVNENVGGSIQFVRA